MYRNKSFKGWQLREACHDAVYQMLNINYPEKRCIFYIVNPFNALGYLISELWNFFGLSGENVTFSQTFKWNSLHFLP